MDRTFEAVETQQNIDYELITPVTEDDLKVVNDFYKTQEQVAFDDPDSDEAIEFAAFHQQGKKIVYTATVYGPPSFILYAKDNNKIIGYSVVTIKDNQVISSFAGVDWNHRRFGIGLKLTKLVHAELRRLGITHYQADVWEGSEKMLYKLTGDGVPIADRIQIEKKPRQKDIDPTELEITL